MIALSALQPLLDSGVLWRAQDRLVCEQTSIGDSFSELCKTFLLAGHVHEWSLDLPKDFQRCSYAPHQLLWTTLKYLISQTQQNNPTQAWHIAWIGKTLWPFPHLLFRSSAERTVSTSTSLFLAPKDKRQLLWTISQVLSSSCFAAVVIDGRGLRFPATRRLQLLARDSSICTFLVRPTCELSQPSAARTRWRVRPIQTTPEQQHSQSWELSLLRAPGLTETQHWIVSLNSSQQTQVHSPNHISAVLENIANQQFA